MSRSYKKPFIGICCTSSKNHKRAKKKMTRSFRHSLDIEDNIASFGHFKKTNPAWDWRPDDGRRYAPGLEKSYRK